jgi:hypothetical protein
MIRLEDALRDALRNPPVQAPVPADPLSLLERRLRRLRRARILLAAGTTVFATLVVVGVVALVGPSSDRTAPATTATPTITQPAPPRAVVDAARSMLAGMIEPTVSGPAEWVRTTHAAYRGLISARDSVPDFEVYVVQIRGRFVCGACSRPVGASAPQGSAIQWSVRVGGGGPTDTGVGAPVDLSRLGTVHTFPVP